MKKEIKMVKIVKIGKDNEIEVNRWKYLWIFIGEI